MNKKYWLVERVMKITLVRHGKTSISLKGIARMDEAEYRVEMYNRATIIDKPTDEIIKVMSGYKYIVCSDLIRSIDSAKALGYQVINLSDERFREADLPYFTSGKLKMPIKCWIFLYRFMSVFGFSLNGESLSMVKSRARIAALELISIAKVHGSVLFVGHSLINRFIAKELLSMSWVGPGRIDTRYWGYDEYCCRVRDS